MPMVTKSIRLTDEEAAGLREYVTATGEVEANVLKRATLRGLRELRLDQAILAYQRGHRASEAAQIAGLPRAIFLQALIDRDVTILEEPPTLAEQLEHLAERFGNQRLADVARQVAEERQ